MVEMVPVAIGALVSVTKKFNRWIEKLRTSLHCWELQGY